MMFLCSSKITDKLYAFLLINAVLCFAPLCAYSQEVQVQSLTIESIPGGEAGIKTIQEEAAPASGSSEKPVIINNYNSVINNPYPYYKNNKEIIYVTAPPAYNRSFSIGGYSYKGGYDYSNPHAKRYYRTPWTPVLPPPPPGCCTPPGSGRGTSAAVHASINWN